MEQKMVDVMIHIDPETTHSDREALRDALLEQKGVDAAAYHDEKPHLIMIEYNPDVIKAENLLKVVTSRGIHGELVGL